MRLRPGSAALVCLNVAILPCVAQVGREGGAQPPASGSLKLTGYQEAPDQPAPASDGASAPPKKGDWEFELSPYLWMASLRTTVDDGTTTATAEACFTDLVENLDLGAMLRFEGRHSSRWGFFVEGLYLKLGDDTRVRVGPARVRGINVDATVTQAEVDFGGLYSFGGNGRALDFLFGGRYTHLGTEIDIGPLPTRESTSDFVAPLVGGRVRLTLSEKWLFSIKADAAGFNVGDAPDITWGVTGVLGYRLNDNAVLGIGYRYYDISTNDDTDIDVSYHGPVIGVAFTF